LTHPTRWLATTLAAATVISMGATAGPAAAAPRTTPNTSAIAAAYAKAHPQQFHLSPRDTLVALPVITTGNLRFAPFERRYAGVPVVGGDFVIVTDTAGRVLDHTSAQDSTLAVDPSPAIAEGAALKAVLGKLAVVSGTTKPRLVVVAQGGGTLSYEVVLTGSKLVGRQQTPSRLHLFVDARTGKLLPKLTRDDIHNSNAKGHYYGDVDIATTANPAGTYTMADPKRPGLACGGLILGPWTQKSNQWGNGKAMDKQTACVDALYAAGKQWDMLHDWLDRNGTDGQGKGFRMRVGLPMVNAMWTFNMMLVGHNQANDRYLSTIDVIAHEFGHAIFQYTPGGSSAPGNEGGGLNESTGDIFGALTEAYANNPLDPPDYTVGELADMVGKGPIRYMNDPAKVGDAGCFSAAIPQTEVHAAAGPQNHWFYLLAEGSNPTNGQPTSPTCDGSSITGLGVQKAGRIFMAALNRKTSDWDTAKARAASVAAAHELYPGSSAECTTVKAAWAAVAVPVAAGEVACG